jgi:hypothetical protein
MTSSMVANRGDKEAAVIMKKPISRASDRLTKKWDWSGMSDLKLCRVGRMLAAMMMHQPNWNEGRRFRAVRDKGHLANHVATVPN